MSYPNLDDKGTKLPDLETINETDIKNLKTPEKFFYSVSELNNQYIYNHRIPIINDSPEQLKYKQGLFNVYRSLYSHELVDINDAIICPFGSDDEHCQKNHKTIMFTENDKTFYHGQIYSQEFIIPHGQGCLVSLDNFFHIQTKVINDSTLIKYKYQIYDNITKTFNMKDIELYTENTGISQLSGFYWGKFNLGLMNDDKCLMSVYTPSFTKYIYKGNISNNHIHGYGNLQENKYGKLKPLYKGQFFSNCFHGTGLFRTQTQEQRFYFGKLLKDMDDKCLSVYNNIQSLMDENTESTYQNYVEKKLINMPDAKLGVKFLNTNLYIPTVPMSVCYISSSINNCYIQHRMVHILVLLEEYKFYLSLNGHKRMIPDMSQFCKWLSTYFPDSMWLVKSLYFWYYSSKMSLVKKYVGDDYVEINDNLRKQPDNEDNDILGLLFEHCPPTESQMTVYRYNTVNPYNIETSINPNTNLLVTHGYLSTSFLSWIAFKKCNKGKQHIDKQSNLQLIKINVPARTKCLYIQGLTDIPECEILFPHKSKLKLKSKQVITGSLIDKCNGEIMYEFDYIGYN